jgi:hypothetical protein
MLDKRFLIQYYDGLKEEYETEYPTREEAEQAQKDLNDEGYIVNPNILEIRL